MPWPSETQRDTEVFGLIDKERERQTTGLQLIASENFTSPDVMEATGSVLTNKYAEGYPGKRYYGGNAVVDDIEAIAIDRVKKLFGADHANVQPHSGASANMAVYLGLIKPGDTVLGLSLDHGGHLTHGSPVNASGILYNFQSFRVGDTDERLDFDQIRELAIKHKPKMIVAGTTSYPRRLEPQPFRAIADEVGALMMFDIAHIAGLVAGGAHPNPVPYADVVTFTTHKTLRGPRGGCILTTAAHAAAIDKAVFPGSQGGPLEHAVAAKAVGKESQLILDEAGITLNKNNIPNDPRSPFVTSGVRIGTPSVTTQGMKEPEMALIAEYIATTLRNRANPAAVAEVRAKVAALCAKFPVYTKRA